MSLPPTRSSCSRKKEDATSKSLDSDEWIRSQTEAQEISADVSEDSVMYDQQAIDLKKGPALSIGSFFAEIHLTAAPGAQ